MGRIGNRIAPGLYAIGSLKNVEAQDGQSWLEHQIVSLDRVTVVRCVYRPGAVYPPHLHPREQVTIVEEGTLRFTIREDEVQVRAGQVISIAERVRHATRVEGDREARALHLFIVPQGASNAA